MGRTIIVDGVKLTFPDSTVQTTKAVRLATLVVAANNSSAKSKAQADYVCDGVNDHLEIQAAIDALPATGGEILLLEGTYNVEVALVLDSYQTLRGCGRNTILTTSTADIDIITATGGLGTEKVGILIADLCVDGTAGESTVDLAIYFIYVDYSRVVGTWLNNCTTWGGITLEDCNFNEITGNTFKGNGDNISLDRSSDNIISGNTFMGDGFSWSSFYLSYSDNNIISGNTCVENDGEGISLTYSDNNIISGNICQRNATRGISVVSSLNNIISGNTCQRNGRDGLSLSKSHNNIISGNSCQENSQAADNAYDNIRSYQGDYNLVTNNLCRAPTIGSTLTVGEPIAETEIAVTDIAGFEVGMGVVLDLGGGNEEYHRISVITGGAPGVITIDSGLTNAQGAGETIDVPRARYGIYILDATSDRNIIKGNDLYDSGKTAPFNDEGTLTEVSDNRGTEITQVRDYAYVKNTSGGALAAGDVVILKAVAAGNEITTTITQGDDMVFGMVAEAIADTASGYVLVLGKTTALKVNGTTAIAIGDLLGTYTEAGISMKAAVGDMAFAIALEAYAVADSSGVIDALLITPRKV